MSIKITKEESFIDDISQGAEYAIEYVNTRGMWNSADHLSLEDLKELKKELDKVIELKDK